MLWHSIGDGVVYMEVIKMKNKFMYVLSSLCVIGMLFANNTTVFAAENIGLETTYDEFNESIVNYSVDFNDFVGEQTLQSSMGIQPLNDYWSGTVPMGNYITLFPTLDNYIGFSQTFTVNATCDSNAGELRISMINPDNKLVISNWVIGPNEAAYKKLTLPKAGRWTIHVAAYDTQYPVNVTVGWRY